MNINFRGLVDLHTLPTSEPLLPLYEAVVNSIQSINQGNIPDGNIYIRIEREESPSLLERDNWETDIENIIIHDNGCGFTEDNFKSFNTYASDFKKLLGCKGVGRMIWLKAFNSVKVESTYCEDDNWFHRSFTFDSVNAVSNESKESVSNNTYNSTTITLQNLRSKNKANTPKKISTIARDLLNHCFIYFVLGKAPKITISDGTESISVNSLFEKIRKEDISTVEFYIEDKSFQLIHFKNYNPNSSIHCLNMCANDRTVSSTNLQSVFSGVNSKFVNAEGTFVYNGYITSDYLDENVNRERTSFNIEDTQKSVFNKVTKSEIVSKATELVFAYLKDELVAYNENKRGKIEYFIRNVNPRYRLLLRRYPECVDNILISDDEEKLELELFKQEQQYKLKLKEEGKELEKTIKSNINTADIVKKTTAYAEKLSEMGKSSLAEYILHRKAVLDILENNLKYQDDNRYAYEESIHQMVFPMQQTSDDVDYTAHNLWLIDEKLSYHYYLASDKKKKVWIPYNRQAKTNPISLFLIRLLLLLMRASNRLETSQL